MNNREFNLSDTIDVIEEVLASGGEFRMYPKGTSMLPLLRQGIDSVVLRRNTDVGAKKHDIAFYQRASGAFVLHRVIKKSKDGCCVMCGDNQTELEYGIKNTQIIGYVSEVYRADKPVMGKLWYKLYVFVWCFMPYRRLELFCKRCLSLVKRKIFKKK